MTRSDAPTPGTSRRCWSSPAKAGRRRVFAIDIETCPKCGGTLRVIACIENPDVIATILEHIRVREAATTANPRAPPLNTEHPAARYQDRLP